MKALLLPVIGLAITLTLKHFWPLFASEYGLPPEHFLPNVGGPFLSAVTLLWVGLLLIRLLDRVVWKHIVARRRGLVVPGLLINVVDIAVWILIVGLINHFVLDLPPGALLTSSGLIVAILAFALKSLISDLFSGIALSLQSPFKIGDWIRVGDGAVGRVEGMSWRAVTLIPINRERISIPNGRVSESIVHVFRVWRDMIEIGLPPETPYDLVDDILRAAIEDIAELRELQAPNAFVDGFGSRTLNWRIFYTLPDYASRPRLRDALIRTLNARLLGAGIQTAIVTRAVELAAPPATGDATLWTG